MTTAAIVLAAGAGTRFARSGRHGPGPGYKLLAPVLGRPVVVHAVLAALEARPDSVLVVTGRPEHATAVMAALVGELGPGAVVEVPNPRWAEGQATSLAAGVAAADAAGHDAVVVGLGDELGVAADAWRAVAGAGDLAPIVVATYGDAGDPGDGGRHRGHPVRLARDVWPLLGTEGDVGARALMAARPDLVAERACTGRPGDVDTLADYDHAAVEALLGRSPQGRFEVVVRHDDGSPLVIRNDPLLGDGRPMPTRYWLVGEPERTAVGRLESTGAVDRAEAEVDPGALAAAHARYAAERDAALPDDWSGPRPSGGVAGTRVGVKCLHAHYAWFLAGGDDPVGRWVADALGERVD